MCNDVQKASNDLKLKFTNIFLGVCKELQIVEIWADQNRDENGKTKWQILFENTLKDLGVIYGYFSEYDPYSQEMKYFLDIPNVLHNDRTNEFQAPYIPYFYCSDKGSNTYTNLVSKLFTNSQAKFKSIKEAPKLYQHLPIQRKGNETTELISDKCLNCFIPCQIREKTDYYVVLFDEIIFYQFAYCYLNKTSLSSYYKKDKEHLVFTYLIKFALSIEQKIGQNKLHEKLHIPLENWNKACEIEQRTKIYSIVNENVKNDKWKEQTYKLFEGIVDGLINEFIQESIDGSFNLKEEKFKILKHISRFDIEASLLIFDSENQEVIFHDLFVFPLYTEKNKPILKTSCVNGVELEIYSPLLLVLYIKTRYLLLQDGVFDEDNDSADGFQLTKEIVKIFAEKIIQEDYLKNVLKKELIIPSTKAAISQVMARNSSHNIGSHVLNKLTGDISQLRLEDFKSYDSIYTNKVLKNENILDQLSKFNNYIKCRMDYLSDITFGIPAMRVNKRLHSEVLSDLDDVRLLLENISGLSDFHYSINIDSRIKRSENEFEIDPVVAMPNDILGCQAFYNIIENVIRNTAKHSDKINVDNPNNNSIIFTIELKPINTNGFKEHLLHQANLLYEVNIYDNVVVSGSADKLSKEEKDEYYDKTQTDNQAQISTIDYLVYNQNKKLNDSILKKDDNTLRSSSLGLIEMEASACYLRHLDVSNLEDDDYNIEYNENIFNSKDNFNILKALKIKAKTQQENEAERFYLGYRFFVLKPTEVLLIGDYQLSSEFENNGFQQLSFEDFQKEIKKGKVFNHQFLVYEDDNTKNLINETETVIDINDTAIKVAKYKTLLPKRIMEIKSLEGFPSSAENVMKLFWEQWAKQVNCYDLCISTAVPENSESQEIHILNHGKNTLSECQKKFFEKWFNDKCNNNYIEALSSNGQQKLPSFFKFTAGTSTSPLTKYQSCIKDEINDKLLYPELYFSITEAAKTNIIILDERVQYAANNLFYEGHSFAEYYHHSRIFVPEKTIDLGANNMDIVKKEIENFIIPFLSMENYLVIHYSIIERFFNKAQNKETAVHKWLNHYSSLSNIIVTSGRGKIKNLPPNIHFVNLSPLLASVIDFRSKYYLHQIIMSSRKPNKV
ncbi:hypothetical protein SAMN05421780_11339 [Flexibacter flexilis DSM 6793]|uniref:Uncharacterized protein n=1 Tax=Flexibacter flexilis DSM 6793 TaxID=927664 RepID=A0A1I1N819_9BACT|nr:hypothetical protein [Flexibacter flexilis]SFC93864.1 hypothetical protein SAMN05421780_11339 [Flexibacter flexilis DSM 6793]